MIAEVIVRVLFKTRSSEWISCTYWNFSAVTFRWNISSAVLTCGCQKKKVLRLYLWSVPPIKYGLGLSSFLILRDCAKFGVKFMRTNFDNIVFSTSLHQILECKFLYTDYARHLKTVTQKRNTKIVTPEHFRIFFTRKHGAWISYVYSWIFTVKADSLHLPWQL